MLFPIFTGDPEHPGLVNGMYWGCAYDEQTDLSTQNLTSPLLKDTFQVWQRSWFVVGVGGEEGR